MAKIVVHQDEDVIKQEVRKLVCQIEPTLTKTDLVNSAVPDIHVLSPTISNSIGIDAMKAFIYRLQFKPMLLDNQFGIIFRSETLTTEAQNSFLKTLEEHSITTHYILGVKDASLLLKTVVSRCQVIFLKAVEKGSRIPEESEAFDSKSPIDRFLFTQEYTSKHKTRSEITAFVDGLLEINRMNLRTDSQNTNRYINNLKLLQKCRNYIHHNVNIQLTLEYIAINYE